MKSFFFTFKRRSIYTVYISLYKNSVFSSFYFHLNFCFCFFCTHTQAHVRNFNTHKKSSVICLLEIRENSSFFLICLFLFKIFVYLVKKGNFRL